MKNKKEQSKASKISKGIVFILASIMPYFLGGLMLNIQPNADIYYSTIIIGLIIYILGIALFIKGVMYFASTSKNINMELLKGLLIIFFIIISISITGDLIIAIINNLRG